MDLAASALRQILAILATAARLAARHWPVLLTVFLIGAAGHGGFLWLAAAASRINPLLSSLVIPLASLSTLIALVLMLRAVGSSLPTLNEGRPAGLMEDVNVVIKVLIPFLAVYASQGILKEDMRTYLVDVTADEWVNKGLQADFLARANFGDERALLVLAVAAVIARKALDASLEKRPRTGVRAVRGYLEALWLTTLAWVFTHNLDAIRDWVLSRSVVAGLVAAYDRVTGLLGPVTDVVDAVLGGPAGALSAMGALVVVPVSWIALGATVYGASLPDPEDLVAPPEAVRARIRRIPNPVRRGLADVVEPVTSPVSSAAKAYSRIAAAGFLPMLVLCLTIAGAAKLRLLVAEGARLLLGPHDGDFWFAFSPYIDVAAQCVYTFVMVVLLAATVDVVIRSARERAVTTAGR